MKEVLYNIKEIEKYLRNDPEKIFNLQDIEKAKVNLIKLEKMNKYLNELNC